MELQLEEEEPSYGADCTVVGPVAVTVPETKKAGKRQTEKWTDEDTFRKEPAAAMPQSKSVAHCSGAPGPHDERGGELVINRTRMLGRVAELERLADVLNFSKARMQDKSASSRKYEFSRIHSSPVSQTSLRQLHCGRILQLLAFL